MSEISLVQTTESTNDLAKSLADEADDGACWVADQQTKGKGRLHRRAGRSEWYSPPGKNIYMSVLSKIDVAPKDVSSLTLVVGANLCELLRDETGLDVRLKWPNDLYFAGDKLGGVLTEAVLAGSGLEAVVTGVGLNVNIESSDWPAEIADNATSLQIAAAETVDRLSLIFGLREAVLSAASTFERQALGAGMVEKIRTFDSTEGQRVQCQIEGNEVEGEAVGISDAGELIVDIDGARRSLRSGEVEFV